MTLRPSYAMRKNGLRRMKVKIDMRFRGRLITRQEVGRKIMNDFIEALAEVGNVEKRPKLEGNTMSVTLSPKKVKK